MLYEIASAPLRPPIDRFARSFLEVSSGHPIDFTQPIGEPAVVPAESLSWVIFKNPITLFIGGVAGVLLELAEPRVRDGVWQNTSFRSDPLDRLKRTGMAAMVTVYGPKSRAEAMIAGVVRMHERVIGETSDGEPYRASDPELLDWVQATAGFGFMEAWHRFVRPLDRGERDRLLREAQPAARLYGAIGAPSSQAALDDLFDDHRGTLVASPIVGEFLQIMRKVPAFPGPAHPLQRMLLKAAIDILPGWVRRRIGLDGEQKLTIGEGLTVRAAAATMERLVLPSLPAVQACRRLGLPDDYLYRGARG
ncbi:MAG TPA: oxygenase MpaB family protein [Pararhizobium sp.]|nr:oxygenase MpaB family protein [Pararhizobium sp.]